MPSTVTHIIPRSVFNNTYHGSYKDTISRVRFFESSGLPYQQIQMDHDKPGAVLDVLKNNSDPAFLIEYCSFPRTIKELRKHFPKSFIAVRSHNIEPLQHLDNYGWWSKKGPIWVAYGMLRLLIADLVMKRHASAILSISDWENRVYWNRLPGRARVEWLPYFCPDHLLPKESAGLQERRKIVCMPTSHKNRKSWDLITRFIAFAEQMKQLTGDRYDYLITGDLSNWNTPDSTAVQYTGMIEDLREFLPTVKAVAMLSGLGYGFKTTISDAIANGAVILAHPHLMMRCPDRLRSAIIPLEIEKSSQFGLLLDRLRLDENYASLNQRLEFENNNILNNVLLPGPKADAA